MSQSDLTVSFLHLRYLGHLWAAPKNICKNVRACDWPTDGVRVPTDDADSHLMGGGRAGPEGLVKEAVARSKGPIGRIDCVPV